MLGAGVAGASPSAERAAPTVCLERFAVLGPPPLLEMVALNHFPGSTRFIGLGQLPPEALRLLWAKRRAVPWADCRVGQGVWQALTAPEPDGLAALLRQGFGGHC